MRSAFVAKAENAARDAPANPAGSGFRAALQPQTASSEPVVSPPRPPPGALSTPRDRRTVHFSLNSDGKESVTDGGNTLVETAKPPAVPTDSYAFSEETDALRRQLGIVLKDNESLQKQVAALESSGSEVTVQLSKQLAEKDRAAAADKAALEAQIAETRKAMAAAATAAADKAALEVQLAETRKTAVADKESLKKQIAAFESSGSEATVQLSKQLAEKDRTAAADKAALEAQLAESRKIAAADKESLQKLIAALEAANSRAETDRKAATERHVAELSNALEEARKCKEAQNNAEAATVLFKAEADGARARADAAERSAKDAQELSVRLAAENKAAGAAAATALEEQLKAKAEARAATAEAERVKALLAETENALAVKVRAEVATDAASKSERSAMAAELAASRDEAQSAKAEAEALRRELSKSEHTLAEVCDSRANIDAEAEAVAQSVLAEVDRIKAAAAARLDADLRSLLQPQQQKPGGRAFGAKKSERGIDCARFLKMLREAQLFNKQFRFLDVNPLFAKHRILNMPPPHVMSFAGFKNAMAEIAAKRGESLEQIARTLAAHTSSPTSPSVSRLDFGASPER